MNQRQGVYLATVNTLADAGVNFDDGQAGGVKPLVTDEALKTIIGLVATGILAGEIEMSAEGRAKYTEEKTMKVYANGLVNNWFRKDKRLNGDTKYEAKNPGSRAGCGDETLKALKALRATKSDAADLAVIDEAIEARKSELGEAKVKTLTAEQIEALPANIRSLLGI